MLKAVLIDDEPAARRALVLLLQRHPELTLVGQAGSVAEGTALIAATAPDVAFLDIELAGRSGFSLVDDLRSPPDIVIVTAHSSHAARAFDVEAVDFLTKPVLPSRFATTVRRLLRRQAARGEQQAARRLGPPSPLRVPTARGLRFLDISRIAMVEADRDYARLTIRGEGLLLASRSLGELATGLPMPPFLRVSRSLILNLSCILSVETAGRDHMRVFLRDVPEPVSLGRTAGAALRRSLLNP